MRLKKEFNMWYILFLILSGIYFLMAICSAISGQGVNYDYMQTGWLIYIAAFVNKIENDN